MKATLLTPMKSLKVRNSKTLTFKNLSIVVTNSKPTKVITDSKTTVPPIFKVLISITQILITLTFGNTALAAQTFNNHNMTEVVSTTRDLETHDSTHLDQAEKITNGQTTRNQDIEADVFLKPELLTTRTGTH